MAPHLEVLHKSPESAQERIDDGTNKHTTNAGAPGTSSRTPSAVGVLVRISVFFLIVPALLIYLIKLLME